MKLSRVNLLLLQKQGLKQFKKLKKNKKLDHLSIENSGWTSNKIPHVLQANVKIRNIINEQAQKRSKCYS